MKSAQVTYDPYYSILTLRYANLRGFVERSTITVGMAERLTRALRRALRDREVLTGRGGEFKGPTTRGVHAMYDSLHDTLKLRYQDVEGSVERSTINVETGNMLIEALQQGLRAGYQFEEEASKEKGRS